MPLYEYECDACGHRFEVIQKFSDSPIDRCPKCGGAVHKLQSAPAFHLKGSGWYITDYGRKESGSSGGESKSGGGSGESKAETKTDGKSETKTDAKSETKTDAAPASSETKTTKPNS